MRCYYEPPQPALIGTKPSAIAGGPPMLVIAGLSPEVHPARFCRHHPLLEGRSQAKPMSTHYAGQADYREWLGDDKEPKN